MSERFTQTLRAASEPGWSDAVGHRFVTELFADLPRISLESRFLQRGVFRELTSGGESLRRRIKAEQQGPL